MPKSKIVRSEHKDKHEREEWNQTTALMGALNGSLKLVKFVTGKTADLLVFTVKGTIRLVGIVVSKPRKNKDHGKHRVIITAFEEDKEKRGYWIKQAKQFEEDGKDE